MPTHDAQEKRPTWSPFITNVTTANYYAIFNTPTPPRAKTSNYYANTNHTPTPPSAKAANHYANTNYTPTPSSAKAANYYANTNHTPSSSKAANYYANTNHTPSSAKAANYYANTNYTPTPPSAKAANHYANTNYTPTPSSAKAANYYANTNHTPSSAKAGNYYANTNHTPSSAKAGNYYANNSHTPTPSSAKTGNYYANNNHTPSLPRSNAADPTSVFESPGSGQRESRSVVQKNRGQSSLLSAPPIASTDVTKYVSPIEVKEMLHAVIAELKSRESEGKTPLKYCCNCDTSSEIARVVGVTRAFAIGDSWKTQDCTNEDDDCDDYGCDNLHKNDRLQQIETIKGIARELRKQRIIISVTTTAPVRPNKPLLQNARVHPSLAKDIRENGGTKRPNTTTTIKFINGKTVDIYSYQHLELAY